MYPTVTTIKGKKGTFVKVKFKRKRKKRKGEKGKLYKWQPRCLMLHATASSPLKYVYQQKENCNVNNIED